MWMDVNLKKGLVRHILETLSLSVKCVTYKNSAGCRPIKDIFHRWYGLQGILTTRMAAAYQQNTLM